MKRIAAIIAFFLIGMVSYAQSYIENDYTEDGTRIISTKAVPVLSKDLDVTAVGFKAAITEKQELYIITIIFFNDNKVTIKAGDMASFRMAEGANVYLKAWMDGSCKVYNENQYMITASYEIPKEKIYDMLKALKTITINYTEIIETSRDIQIPFSSAEALMNGYLELLIKTGN